MKGKAVPVHTTQAYRDWGVQVYRFLALGLDRMSD